MLRCRWFVDEPLAGAWNMAVDEAMLQSALSHPERGATLRWYRWKHPTLSLGYFQSYRERPEELASLDCVRRLTGGGAILHHHEITYSLVIPPDMWPFSTPKEMVLRLHQCVAEVLGTICEPRPPEEDRACLHPGAALATEPFLCFLRRSHGDLVVGEHKVLGSAQRNRRGALLQHGSILLQTSAHTPMLEGLGQRVTDPKPLQTAVQEMLTQDWHFNFEPGGLSPEEIEIARELETAKYRSPDWNERR